MKEYNAAAFAKLHFLSTREESTQNIYIYIYIAGDEGWPSEPGNSSPASLETSVHDARRESRTNKKPVSNTSSSSKPFRREV